jgi:hypothetical protein
MLVICLGLVADVDTIAWKNTTSPVFNALLLRVRPMVDFFYGQDAD